LFDFCKREKQEVINNEREDKKKHKEDNETEREKYLEE
jgi:hypothetical protein